VLHAVPSA